MEENLKELQFADLYVRLDGDSPALYRSSERGKNIANKLVPKHLMPDVQVVAGLVMDQLKDRDGSITVEGMRCRVSQETTADGERWACLRRISTVVPSLDTLGYSEHILPHLRSLGRRDGLILVSGATGQGKTTTAAALLQDYLKMYGGVAVTIEDPVEFVMRGRVGEFGHCFQFEAHRDEDWALLLKKSLRWAPRYIFVGEIRTPKAAEQLLRAATTGHLVITTVHAGAPEEALMGLVYLAEQAMGPGVNNILAAGLTGLLYQTMQASGPFVRYLFTEENNTGDPVRGLIRENKIGMINSYIDKIAARLVALKR